LLYLITIKLNSRAHRLSKTPNVYAAPIILNEFSYLKKKKVLLTKSCAVHKVSPKGIMKPARNISAFKIFPYDENSLRV